MQDRRKFIKSTCSICFGAIGFGILLSESGCKPSEVFTSEPDAEKISVPLRILKDKKTLVIKNSALDYPVLLVKKSESEYAALLMKCTHKGVELKMTGEKLGCPSHGSMFDLDGNVLMTPASKPLTKFPVVIEGDMAMIRLKNS